jgi:hypothetical protein
MPGLKDTLYNCGFQQITSLAASTALTVPDIPGGGGRKATFARIQCTAQSVRWRDDGTAPTASVGMLMTVAPNELQYDGDLAAIRFIEAAGGAVLNISYYA